MLATTIAQRHARCHERHTADDEDLAHKRGGVAGLGKYSRRGLLLGSRRLCGGLRNLGLGLRLALRLGLMILVVLGLCGSQGILGIAKLGKRGGIGVVGIGQLGIGIAQSSLEPAAASTAAL